MSLATPVLFGAAGLAAFFALTGGGVLLTVAPLALLSIIAVLGWLDD